MRGAFLTITGMVWLALALGSSLNKSATADEVPHLGAGLSALQFRDFRMNPEHPPLFKELAALPVWLFCRPNMAVHNEQGTLNSWLKSWQTEYGYYLLFMAGRAPARMLLLARVFPALFGLLGGVFAFLWGRELSDRWLGGALSAGLLLFYPEYLGHSRLLVLDVPTLVGCGAVSWFALRWRRKPTWRNALVFAAIAAVGSQIKLPITVFTVFTLVTLAVQALLRPGRWKAAAHTLALGIATGALIILGMWAGSDFRYASTPPGAEIEVTSIYIPKADAKIKNLRDKAVEFCREHRLLPETTLATINHSGSFGAREMFLFSEKSLTGWYRYFFVTIATKTPVLMLIGFVLVLIAGTVWLVRGRHSRAKRWRIERGAILLVPFAMLFALYVHSRPNIGHRQIMFIYLPLTVLLGSAAARWVRAAGWRRLSVVGLLATQAANIGFSYPHYETYFNEFIRNPYHGSTIVSDSNVDWGQDVPLLARALQDRGYNDVNYAVFGYNDPASWGIPHIRWMIPYYPFAVYMPPAEAPDERLPTAVSLNLYQTVRRMYPDLYARKPDLFLNSIMVYLPRR